MDIIFPWDWTKAERQIDSDNNLQGVNYLTQVYYWGNEGMGPTIPLLKQKMLVDGPSGFLDKFDNRSTELENLDYVCEGMSTERCPWPMGAFSQNIPLC